jgi:Zn-finger nucleic acid-binding protein
MEAHFYAGGGNVVMDTCETCCLHWLDHDELARIAQANPRPSPTPSTAAPDSFYDRDSDDTDSIATPLDPATEVIDLLSRVLKRPI